MKPGVHKLTIKYYIQDVFTKVSDVITKHYPSFDYKENTYYPMPANLKILNYSPMYYMWDAKQNYWYPHQWGTTDVWQPKVSAEILSSHATHIIRTIQERKIPPQTAGTTTVILAKTFGMMHKRHSSNNCPTPTRWLGTA